MRVALACVAVLALAACAAGGAAGVSSGLRFHVTSSPSCPVERMPPDPSCAPKPVDAKLQIVSRATNKTVARARTGTDGRVSVRLHAGRYRVVVKSASGSAMPRCPAVAAVVPRGRYRRVAISCDSGIR